MNVVCILDGDDHGSNYYRGILPMRALREHSGWRVDIIRKGDPAGLVKESLAKSDLYLVPRFAAKDMFQKVIALRLGGKKVVADYDDDVSNVSPLSPHYSHYGTKNVQYDWGNGEVVDIWKHGVNIDVIENKERLDMIYKCIGDCDILSVTTDILKEKYTDVARKVVVLPNCIDLRMWNRLPYENDKIKLFWAGGASHYEEWLILAEALPVIMAKYPNVILTVMGSHFKGTLSKLPSDRVELLPWVHSEAYPYRVAIANPDISLIPLVDNQFNRCKSPIKFIEMSALSTPSVVSWVSPYKELMTEDNGVFIEKNDIDSWIEGISILVENRELRKHMGKEARKYVEERYDINTQWVQWRDAYEAIA